MTTKQLYDEIRIMGFDRQSTGGEADAEAVFCAAVNRAQETLAAVFPLYETLLLTSERPTPCMTARNQTVDAHNTYARSCGNARSYCVTVRGEGEVSIKRNNLLFASYSIASAHGVRTFYGEFPENGRLTFLVNGGESALEIIDLQVYAEAGAAREKFADSYVYRLSTLLVGALSLAEAPIGEDGTSLRDGTDYRTENGILYVSEKIKCNLKLTLRRAPRHFDMGCESPDVSDEAAHLLPLLTAAYVWLDDDRDKALFYLAMYRESLAASKKNREILGRGGYRTENGW